MRSAVATVSAIVAPGGSSIRRTERDRSLVGRKPYGKDPAIMIEPKKISPPSASGQQRRYQPRDQQRECDRDGDREAELLEILASDAAHEADRHEHGDDGHGRRDYREPDLVRCPDGGPTG